MVLLYQIGETFAVRRLLQAMGRPLLSFLRRQESFSECYHGKWILSEIIELMESCEC